MMLIQLANRPRKSVHGVIEKEDIMTKAQKKILNPDETNDMFLGIVKASYKEMVEAFGKPEKGDGYKTEAEWHVKLDTLCEVTIYNYKNSKSYDSKNPPIKSVREWSVNGNDSDAIEWVKGALGQETR
jgi:hypothetical protein